MPQSEAQPGPGMPEQEVLTLREAAAYLRVPEEAVMEAVDRGDIPARRIGGEWRLLKRALVEYLRSGPHVPSQFGLFPPPWMFEPPDWEGMFSRLERRILGRLLPIPERPPAEPGSKRAVLGQFGAFEGDADIEEQLAEIRARREAAEPQSSYW